MIFLFGPELLLYGAIFWKASISKRNIKLVLMSAPFDAMKFVEYFSVDADQPPVMIQIPGRTYDVSRYYLEDIIPWVPRYEPDFSKISYHMAGPNAVENVLSDMYS